MIWKAFFLYVIESIGIKSILRKRGDPLLDILIFFFTEVPDVVSTDRVLLKQ